MTPKPPPADGERCGATMQSDDRCRARRRGGPWCPAHASLLNDADPAEALATTPAARARRRLPPPPRRLVTSFYEDQPGDRCPGCRRQDDLPTASVALHPADEPGPWCWTCLDELAATDPAAAVQVHLLRRWHDLTTDLTPEQRDHLCGLLSNELDAAELAAHPRERW